jgi:hypothetical protein
MNAVSVRSGSDMFSSAGAGVVTSAHGGDSSDPSMRMRAREIDVAESQYLLLELGTQDPVVQHCLNTLQGVCLSQGVKLAKKGTHDQDPEDGNRWSSQATAKFQVCTCFCVGGRPF